MCGSRINLADWYSVFAAHFAPNTQHTPEPLPAKSLKLCKSDKVRGKLRQQATGVNCPQLLARFERVLLQLQYLGIIKKSGDHVKCLMFNK